MTRRRIALSAFLVVLAVPPMARAASLDGQWQGTSPQARSSSGGFCSLGYFLDVSGDKLSGIVQTANGEGKFETTIKPDGSFTYTARFATGSPEAGRGKFAGDKFTATQGTACGELTASGVHIG